jgi:ATP:ADP antiporter, AAA family
MSTTTTLFMGPRAALARALDIKPAEVSSLVWSFAMFFAVLASYFTVRPVREMMGAGLPKGELAQLFTVVFLVMLALVPLFGYVATRAPRRLVLPAVYAFFIANLIAFSVALHGSKPEDVPPWLASTFFVWVSVYNLFVVSLFWSLMADRWGSEEGKRLFGVISAGGTIGALAGPLIAGQLVGVIGTANLAIVSAAFLGLALVASFQLSPAAIPAKLGGAPPPATIALMIEGATRIFQSPYLGRIALVILLANLVSTFFYLEQARLVKATISGGNDRVAFFASRDLIVSVVTALIQLFGTAALLRRFGLTAALAALPVVAILGLLVIGTLPTLGIVSGVMAFERITAFALAGPAMRVLYTVVDPAEKYKAQNFIDTVVYRGGDALSGWMFGIFASLALSPVVTIAITLPFAIAWLVSCLGLGRMQAERAGNRGG